MADRSKLIKMKITNIGCVGPEGFEIDLDNILCLVGANNTGKSTVLRAYELALRTEEFSPDRDLCKRANGESAAVGLSVHIPEGTANIAEKWKEPDNEYRLVRSRWQWSSETAWSSARQTWNPEGGEYSENDQASGLYTVGAVASI